ERDPQQRAPGGGGERAGRVVERLRRIAEHAFADDLEDSARRRRRPREHGAAGVGAAHDGLHGEAELGGTPGPPLRGPARPVEAPRRGAVQDGAAQSVEQDRKSTRLNSSHVKISYAVFCLKKKNTTPS